MSNNDDKQLPAIKPSEYGLPDQPVAEVLQIADALTNAEGRGYNVLTPTMRLEYIPPGHQVSIRVVKFPTEFTQADNRAKSNGTWYKVSGGKLALHGSALNMLAAAAGISIVSTHVERTSRHVWTATVGATMTGFDGQPRYMAKSKIVDLRDGSDEAKAAGDGVHNARKHGAALAESKAANRAIRALLGLQGAYKPEQAAQPFVFPRLIFVPDMSNPEIARMVTAKALGIVGDVYGPAIETEGPVVADVNNVVDADVSDARALTDQSTLDDLETAGAGREREPVRTGKTAAHPDDDQTLEPPPMGPVCEQCAVEVSDRVAEYSRGQFQKVLCRPHQPRR